MLGFQEAMSREGRWHQVAAPAFRWGGPGNQAIDPGTRAVSVESDHQVARLESVSAGAGSQGAAP